MEKKTNELSHIDANFVISSFKNKERRNNPSSIPRALVPPGESEKMNKVDESGNAGSGNTVIESNVSDNSNIPDVDTITDETIGGTVTTKKTNSRKRKLAFEEYQNLFLITPKIKHRKPVFISEELRDRLDEIAMRLGKKGMSASGLIENMVIHHLKTYEEDIEYWRKL